jgi:DNA-binding MarR family transcriptional regulator
MNDSQRILDSIRRLVRLLRLQDRAAQSSAGLSSAQLFVLAELGKAPSLSLNELAERTLTDQSSVSVVVTRLVDAGLVVRERSADDARRLQLSLTRAGKTALERAPAVAQEQILAVLDKMKTEERRQFADLFVALVGQLGGEPGSAEPMLFEEDAGEPRVTAPTARAGARRGRG